MSNGNGPDLITGANGFCAVHLARRLRSEGRTVTGVGREREWRNQYLSSYHEVDLRSGEAVERFLRAVKPSRLFHLAGVSHGTEEELFSNNVGATCALLEAAARVGSLGRVLVVGSAAEYGLVSESDLPVTEERPCRPATPYGHTKHEMVRYALDFGRRAGMDVVIARPFNIIGAGMPTSLVAGALIARLRKVLSDGSSEISMGRLDTARDFLAVEDVVEAYARMMEQGTSGEVYNICAGRATRIAWILEKLLEIAGAEVVVTTDPALVREDDVVVSYGSVEKAREAFGFLPRVPIEDALSNAWNVAVVQETIRWP